VTRVIFKNMSGNLRITGGDLPEVRITGHKTIRAFHKSDADETDRITPIEINSEGDRLVVRGSQDRVSGEQRVTADLEIVLPRSVAVEAHDRSGDIEVTDVSGDVEINSGRADVRLTKLGGNARVSLTRSDLIRAVDVKGNLDLHGHGSDVQLENVAGLVTVNGSYSGTLNFRNLARPLHFTSPNTNLQVQALPGQLSMDLGDFTARNLVGPIHLKTKTKDVRIEDFTDALELETDRGDIQIQPGHLPLARIEAHSRSGKIELAIPDKAAFHLLATARHGEVMNDFGPPLEKETDGRSSSLKGATGRGAEISITTDRGSVLVRKAGAETEKAGLQPEKF